MTWQQIYYTDGTPLVTEPVNGIYRPDPSKAGVFHPLDPYTAWNTYGIRVPGFVPPKLTVFGRLKRHATFNGKAIREPKATVGKSFVSKDGTEGWDVPA